MGGLYQKSKKKEGRESWIKGHSLSLVLIAILIIQSVLYHALIFPTWKAEQISHGEELVLKSYWIYYWAEWILSALADTYGVLLAVLVTKYFYERGSAESK